MTERGHTPDSPGPESGPETGPESDAFHLEVTSLSTGRSAPRKPRPRWLRAVQMVSVVLVVALVLGAVVVLPRIFPSTDSRTSVVQGSVSVASGVRVQREKGVAVMTFGGLPFLCPSQAAWSPDSTRVAILGYGVCGTTTGVTGPTSTRDQNAELAIYDVASGLTGTPQSLYSLDSLVNDRLRQIPVGSCCVYATYLSVSWAPDGKTVAVDVQGTFPINDSAMNSAFDGLLLLPNAGNLTGDGNGQARMLLSATPMLSANPATNPAPTTFDPTAPYTLPRWDVSRGQEDSATIQPSLAYRWDSNTLTATAPLAAPPTVSPAAPAGPVGNPDGGASFSLWQTGILEAKGCPDASGRGLGCIALVLSTGSPVWSPDGAVALGPVSVVGQLDMPIPPNLSDPNLGENMNRWSTPLPLLPVRDAGLRAAIASLSTLDAPLAWSPDGTRIAVLSAASVGQGAAPYAVWLSVYDCASGNRLAFLPSPSASGWYATSWSLAWSPDGQHLVLLSHDNHSVTVYDSSALGR